MQRPKGQKGHEMEDLENLYDAGQEEVVDPQSNPYDDGHESAVDSLGEEDYSGEENGDPQDAADTGVADRKPAKQSRRANHEAKLARQAAEKATEERMRAEYDRMIAAAGLENPYTGKRMETVKDFTEYSEKLRDERLQAEAKRTGKSVAVLREEEDNRAFLSNLRRAQQQIAAPAQAEPAFDLASDAEDFAEAYPDVDIVKLEQDKSFRRFAGTRLYREPITQLYEDYLELTNGAAQAATAKAQSKAQRSTGAGSTGGEVQLTNLQKKQLEEWNRKYPGMKMTAKEFLGR